MKHSDLLIEIGVEEIPVDSIGIAADFLKQSFEKLLADSHLRFESLKISSSPRRLVLFVNSLDARQDDLIIQKTGPAVSIAYDASGNPSPAAAGFLKKNNAKAEDIYIETTEKGRFIALRQEIPGKASPELIAEWFPRFLSAIPFPKKMIWDGSGLSFIRPLRWILALWDEQILPLEAYGIKASNLSLGNRWLGLDYQVRVERPGEYFDKLRAARVIADREQRKALILDQLATICPAGETVEQDLRLVETVTDLVEDPNAVLAEFDPAYLNLPEKIITSTISQNQKYFAVHDAAGKLTNHFVFISNGDPAQQQLIRRGNEKVVQARLADAMWYYREDTRQPLESYLPALKDVVFQARLGSLAAKSARITKITAWICDQLGFTPAQKAYATRASALCKADLVTSMLGEKEFTKLQGYIGKQYALAGGEAAEVAAAIQEHYMPRGQGDSLPESVSGAVVAIADKLDTVCGIISIGMIPTGSGDPYALRRAAGGIVQILADRDWDLDLGELTAYAGSLIEQETPIEPGSSEKVNSFLQGRVKWLLQQYKIDYDVIDSVMHIDMAHLVELKYRALALQAYRIKADFIKLVIGFKRVSNIIAEAKDFASPDPELLAEEAEKQLYQELQLISREIDSALAGRDYDKAIGILVHYGSYIDRFFDAVMVNTEDTALRQNRYNLLNLIRQEFLRVADLSLLVIE